MEEGEFERAAELFEESLAIGEARGDLDRRARALVNLGYAAHGLGDGARARELYGRALTAAEEIGLVEAQLWALLGVAAYEAEAGDAVAAARLLGRVKQLESELRVANDDQGEEFKRRTLAALRLALDAGAARSRARCRRGAVARGSHRPRTRKDSWSGRSSTVRGSSPVPLMEKPCTRAFGPFGR